MYVYRLVIYPVCLGVAKHGQGRREFVGLKHGLWIERLHTKQKISLSHLSRWLEGTHALNGSGVLFELTEDMA